MHRLAFILGLTFVVGCSHSGPEASVSSSPAFDSAAFWGGKSQAPAGENVPLLCRQSEPLKNTVTYIAVLYPSNRLPQSMPASSRDVSAGSTFYENALIVVTEYEVKTGQVIAKEQIPANYDESASSNRKTGEAHRQLTVYANSDSSKTSSNFFGPMQERDVLLEFVNGGEDLTHFKNATKTDHRGLEENASIECKVQVQ